MGGFKVSYTWFIVRYNVSSHEENWKGTVAPRIIALQWVSALSSTSFQDSKEKIKPQGCMEEKSLYTCQRAYALLSSLLPTFQEWPLTCRQALHCELSDQTLSLSRVSTGSVVNSVQELWDKTTDWNKIGNVCDCWFFIHGQGFLFP